MDKICNTCLLTKDISEFKPSKRHRDGYDNRCRECAIQRKRQYNAENKERIDAYNRAKYAANPEPVKAKSKRYRRENNEDCRAKDKQYKLEHREVLKIKNKEYRSRPEVKEAKNARERERRHNDPLYDLMCKIRSRLKKYITRKTIDVSSLELIGCSPQELKEHLERQFYPNPNTGEMMTWENHSQYGWHIDHIIPLASINFADHEQIKKVCHYSNLQPLWWFQNLSKGKRQ